MYRFIINCRKPLHERVIGLLTQSEQHHALFIWVRQCQSEAYSTEVTNLKNKSTNRSPLYAILHTDKLIHYSGRIHNAPLSYMAKFPLLSLKPAHLLHGHCITSLPHTVKNEQDLSDLTYSCVTDVSHRAQLQAFLLNQFQAHWRYEYPTSIRECH